MSACHRFETETIRQRRVRERRNETMSRKLILRGRVVLAAGGAVLAAAWGGRYLTQQDSGLKIVSKSPADGALPEPGTVPIGGPFTLVDHQGRTVTEQDFGNRYLDRKSTRLNSSH